MGNTQTGQAMAIFYGLITDEEKPKVLNLLLKYIDEADGSFQYRRFRRQGYIPRACRKR